MDTIIVILIFIAVAAVAMSVSNSIWGEDPDNRDIEPW